jgi:hypothetical protein
MHLAISNDRPADDPRRETAAALGPYYVWAYFKRPTDPEWEDLTAVQQAHIRAAFRFSGKAISPRVMRERAS